MSIRTGTCASAVLRKQMNSWCRWRCMLRPMTVPSSTLRAAILHRQTGLGAVERLDWALLINREDDGVGGRIDIETDDVAELLAKLRVLRQFERPDTVRRELVSFQDALHRTQAHSGRLGKFPARPVGALARRRPQGQIDHPLNGVGRQRGLTRLARLVAQQPFDALR